MDLFAREGADIFACCQCETEEFKEHIREYAEASREKYAFLFAFSSKLSIREHIKSYAENLKKLRSEKKEK